MIKEVLIREEMIKEEMTDGGEMIGMKEVGTEIEVEVGTTEVDRDQPQDHDLDLGLAQILHQDQGHLDQDQDPDLTLARGHAQDLGLTQVGLGVLVHQKKQGKKVLLDQNNQLKTAAHQPSLLKGIIGLILNKRDQTRNHIVMVHAIRIKTTKIMVTRKMNRDMRNLRGKD